MENVIFVSALACLFYVFLAWGFRSLTREDWQIALTTPTGKLTPHVWMGRNYTYYGVFQAVAFTTSAALLCVLVAALDLRLSQGKTLLLIGTVSLLACCGAKMVARIVERKKHTLTIAGAFFVGFLVAPWLILLLNRAAGGDRAYAMPVMPLLAAGMAAYAIGEGLGRLACISFGCCYGKPVSLLHPLLRRLLRRCAFTFAGKTKKIAYEAGLDGTEVVPIQAITAVFLVSAGLVGVSLFLSGFFGPAFLLCAVSSQVWRYVSEMLRADHRGAGRTSAYQIMAIVSIAYAALLWALFPGADGTRIEIARGVARLWNPAVVLTLQALGAGIFLFTGRSSVTESSITFRVREDRV